MAKKEWRYTNSNITIAGTMICTSCNKGIGVARQFRYHCTDKGYVVQHRECSKDDPNWAIRDDVDAKQAAYNKARREAYEAFVEQWGEPFDLISDQ